MSWWPPTRQSPLHRSIWPSELGATNGESFQRLPSRLILFNLPLLNSPGRFLAAIEIKALLAHIVVTYDVKFEEGKGFPPERHMGLFRYPGNADVLFRKRQR